MKLEVISEWGVGGGERVPLASSHLIPHLMDHGWIMSCRYVSDVCNFDVSVYLEHVQACMYTKTQSKGIFEEISRLSLQP